jgi:hypothetical protein
MACRERPDELLVLRSWFGSACEVDDALAADEKRLGGSRKVEGSIKWHRAHRLGQQPQAPCGGVIEQPDRIGRVGHLSLSFASQQRVAAEAGASSGVRQALKRLVEKGRRSSVGIDDAHLTAHYIDELWQGVQTGIPEHLPDLGRFARPDRDRVFRIVN